MSNLAQLIRSRNPRPDNNAIVNCVQSMVAQNAHTILAIVVNGRQTAKWRRMFALSLGAWAAAIPKMVQTLKIPEISNLLRQSTLLYLSWRKLSNTTFMHAMVKNVKKAILTWLVAWRILATHLSTHPNRKLGRVLGTIKQIGNLKMFAPVLRILQMRVFQIETRYWNRQVHRWLRT